MNINPLSSATNLISSAQQKAGNAAQTIASIPVQSQEVGGNEAFKSTDLFKPVLSLKEAEFETSAATKVIKAQNEMLGSLLDINA
ncbi:hypothetical protein IVG45_14515 [Methylomonas sp. LL1]|uniref:hypothetical protein n=1 Tax=Methylomonas sp. LL1 TaxID=2785785 RepID=UPI0018C38E5F|nr:hypothetical protein [Methylomonas sp. LL1]QPK62067.1 hypothetical protein IVG45_14515 [Methylomonas sp. LL1]